MIKINSRKITLLVILLLILLVLGLLISKLTTGYVKPFISPDVKNEGEITASGDKIIFTNDELSLKATADNFKTGSGNLTDTANPKVTLIASTASNQADTTYYVGFNISENSYTYSSSCLSDTCVGVSDGEPELILTIKDETGTEVTSINGLAYTSSGGVSGFDITDKTGLFDVDLKRAISTTSSTTGTTHTWTFTLTFVNLSTDQSINENANLKIDIYMQQKVTFFSSYIKNLYVQGSESTTGLYYHNGQYKDTDGTTVLDANDGSYRYAGASDSVNNYVCISDEENCSDDNLFRIIGVFNEGVKLIKATSIESKAWDSNNSNVWANASLNTYLNNDYLSTLGNFATNYIATTTWKVGGNTRNNIIDQVPATTYTNEITGPATSTTVSKKIGLMYASDYGFAASKNSWSTKLIYYYSVADNNWAFLGVLDVYEWLITPPSSNSYSAYLVDSNGNVNYSSDLDNGVAGSNAVRPTFYLKSTISYKSGSGSASKPFRLKNSSYDYDPPVVVDVNVTNSTSNLNFNVAVESTKEISKYYYTIYQNGSQVFTKEDTSSSFSSSESGLTISAGTTYDIEVYVEDVNGKVSAVYKTSASISCFIAGTKISTSYGLKNIEDIKVGDYVYTINEISNTKELKKVTNTKVSETSITYKIIAGKTSIEASPRHPFYVVDKGYVKAYDLEAGDLLLTTNGTLKIDEIKTIYHEIPLSVYNLGVEDNHNFLVSSSEILVHNSPG